MAVPVVTYCFNIVNWKLSELKKLDTKTRKFLTVHKMHHPKSDVDRLFVARNYEGRGLSQLETGCRIATIGLSTFLKSSDDPLLVWCKCMMPERCNWFRKEAQDLS